MCPSALLHSVDSVISSLMAPLTFFPTQPGSEKGALAQSSGATFNLQYWQMQVSQYLGTSHMWIPWQQLKDVILVFSSSLILVHNSHLKLTMKPLSEYNFNRKLLCLFLIYFILLDQNVKNINALIYWLLFYKYIQKQ